MVDAYDQETPLKKGTDVVAELVSEGAVIVRLKNMRKGHVFGQIKSNEALFSSIAIDHAEWPEPGSYSLVFKVRGKNQIESAKIEVNVLEDRTEAEKLMEYSTLEANMQKYVMKLKTIDEEIDHYTSVARSILEDASSGVPDHIRNLSDGLTQQSIDTYIRELEDQTEDMKTSLQQKRIANGANQNTVGNLFYVDDDESLAKLLSWASKGYFSARLVEDVESARAKGLVQQGVRLLLKKLAVEPILM